MSAEVRTTWLLGLKFLALNVTAALRIRFRLAQEDLDAYRQRGGWHRTRDLRHHQQTSWSVASALFLPLGPIGPNRDTYEHIPNRVAIGTIEME